MSRDPRIDELLAGYPDDLSDAELAELRAAAEQDPELDELMFSLLEADAELAGASDGPGELSEGGQARIDGILDGVATAWSTGGALPTGSVNEEPTAWSTGGALPTGSTEEGPEAQVHSLADARRRLRSNPAFLALAAGLLLAVGFMVRDVLSPPTPGFTFKGDGTEGSIRGTLFVMGETRIEDGARRPADQAITFTAQMTDPASLVLLETQGGRTFVIHPAPGAQWRGVPGPNRLVVGGQTDYRPAVEGRARYTLIASPKPFDIPPDREVESPEAFGLAHDAVGLTDLSVTWEAAGP